VSDNARTEPPEGVRPEDHLAYRLHVSGRPWLVGSCTCRNDAEGKRFFTCARKACDGEGQACGGYCRPCFDRIITNKPERPEVICLCGSTKFKDEFEQVTRAFGLEGKIVLTVACFGHQGELPPEACIDGHPTKTALDELHKRKIDMADRIFVVNVGGYIGSSTRSEIEYAEWFEKPIDYLVDLHQSAEGAS
jgi:hypothetical protein